jgi:2-methylcitrate dehydratase PrpD
MNDGALLAAFAVNTRSFPPEAIEQAKRMVVDGIACQIAFATLPWSRAYRAAMTSLGSGGGATVVYYGDRTSIDNAAFLNSAFLHANEYDDTHLGSGTHPGSIVLAPSLALAEQRGRSGRAVLEAMIVGAEVTVRIAQAASPHLHERAHTAPGTCGPFGSAAGCSRLIDADAATCLNALGIAGSHSGGVLEYQRTGGSVKRILGAIPGVAGLRSAVMAEHGITGPRSVLEGERGFFRAYTGGVYDPDLLTGGLGEEFRMLRMSFKPFACNLSTHAAVEALGTIVTEHQLAAADVVSIEIGVSRSALGDVGAIVEPEDILGAQSSLQFGSAVRLLRGGNGPADYREEDLRDPRFLAIVHAVKLVVDPICDEERERLKNRPAIVTVQTTDGRTLSKRVQFPNGSPERPLSNDDLNRKFLAAVTPVLGPQRTDELLERIWTIEQMPDAGDLLQRTLCHPELVEGQHAAS